MTKQETLSRFNILRGMFALQIVLGHVVQYEVSPVHIFGKFMIISVAYFLFVSAIGLTNSFEKNESYLNGFLRKKVLYLICITLIAYIFAIVPEILTPISYKYYQPDVNIFITLLTTTNWYVFELIVFYICFLMCFKFFKARLYRAISISLLSIIIIVLSYIFLYEAYYASSLAFPLGIVFWLYYDSFTHFLKSLWGYFTTIVLLMLGLFCFFLNESFITMVILRNCMCIGGIFLLYYIITFVNFNNSITMFFTYYSTEIYFLQFCIIRHVNELTFSWPVRCIIAIPVVICSSLLMAPVRLFLKRKLFS